MKFARYLEDTQVCPSHSSHTLLLDEALLRGADLMAIHTDTRVEKSVHVSQLHESHAPHSERRSDC